MRTATVPDNFFVILADVFDSQNCDRSPSVYLKTPNSKSLLILLTSAGRAKSLQSPAIAGGNHRSPHKFAASHGSARRRETRQRRSRTLANAVCVTARAPRLARIYCWFSSPQLSQWDEENPRLTALDANRLFDVVILQNCQIL